MQLNISKITFGLIFFQLLLSCTTYTRLYEIKTTNQQPNNTAFQIFSIEEELPAGSDITGKLAIKDPGLAAFNIGLDDAIIKAKEKALFFGGNAIQITKIKPPSSKPWGSAAYRLEANIIKLNTNHDKGFKILDSFEEIKLNEDSCYIIFYRPKNYYGKKTSYPLLINSKYVGIIKNGTYIVVKAKLKESFNILAKSGIEVGMQLLNPEKMQYFIRCGIERGKDIGHPTLNLVEDNVAIVELNGIIAIND